MNRSAFGLLLVFFAFLLGIAMPTSLCASPDLPFWEMASAKIEPRAFSARATTPNPDRPNIVVILVDDMGFSDLGCYGSEIQTPVLDQLAANGRQFRRFYNTAKCSPTRAALLTGQYPHAAGMENLTTSSSGNSPAYLGYLSPNTVTLAEVLGAAGYGTYLSGKWHVGEQQNQGRWPTDRGFDRYWGLISGANSFFEITPGENRQMALDNQQWDPDTDYTPALMQQHGRTDFYMTDATADFAIDFLTEHQTNRPADPFFLYMSFTAPHWPLHAYPEDIAKYDGVYDIGWDQIRADRLQKMIDNGLLPPGTSLSNRDGQAWNNIPPDDGDMDIDKDQGDRAFRMQTYAAQIDRMDQAIGKLVDYLQSTGELDNTLILFMSDNGGSSEDVQGRNNHQTGAIVGTAESYMSYLKEWSNASNTPFRLHKNFVEEGGIATPLIAHWPLGINNPGTQTDQIGHVKDIMATVLDITSIDYPTQFNGNSILPLSSESFAQVFSDPNADEEREIFFEYNGRRAVRSGKWKILSGSPNGSWSLYNLEDDPIEVDNLAGTYPRIVQQLSARYELWETSVGHQSGSLPDPAQAPVLANPFANQVLAPNGAFSFDIPEKTFTDEAIDVLQYHATLSDGSPLPAWLEFEPITGTFSGTAPDELPVPLAIELTAIDWNENLATDNFLISLGNVAAPEVLYREVFGNNNTETNPTNGVKEPLNPVAEAGWTSYFGAGANLVVNFGREDDPPKVQVSGFDGRPGNLENVNAGPTLDQVSGFLFGSLTESPVLSYTEEYSLDLTAYENLEFSWYQGHNSAGTTYLAIRIDGQWYVSTAGQTNPSISSATLFATQAELKTISFDPAAANWNTLNFDPSLGQLGIGAPAAANLPTGQLDAFGLLTEGTLNSLRLDAFTITGSAIDPGVADLQVNPASVDFGSVEPATSSTPQTVDLSNAGGSPLAISSITLTDNPDGVFALTGLPTLPITLEANEILTEAFSISFAPQSEGPASAKIQIISDDPDEATFEIMLNGAGAVPICSPISTLPCPQVPLELPVVFDFDQDESGLADQNGAGIGFTAVMEHSEARRAGDLPISNPQVNGYEPSLLTLNTTDGQLEMVSQAGIAFRDPPESSNNNNQVNTLGVGLQNITETILVKTILKNVNTGGGFAQFGLWFGFDEDNFVKFNIQNSDLALRVESGGITEAPDQLFAGGIAGLPGADVTLELEIDPNNLTVKGFYTVGNGQRTQIQDTNGDLLPMPADYLTGRTLSEVGSTTFAGVFITHRNGSPFTGIVDHFSVEAITNLPPVADAGPDQTLLDADEDGSEDVSLDGSASTDPEGDTPLSYRWLLDGDTEIATGVQAQVSLPVGVHTIVLEVTDTEGNMGTDDILVTIEAPLPTVAIPFRMNVGSTSSYDLEGDLFEAENVAYLEEIAETTVSENPYDLNSPHEGLYFPRRFGPAFDYHIPVADGEYRVVLHMVENFFEANNERVFSVSLEGATVLSDLDLFAQFQLGNPYLFEAVTTVSDGVLDIGFSASVNNAIVQAIEILPAEGTPSSENDILTFTLADLTEPATINSQAHTVVGEVQAGTDLQQLSPVITVSEGATINPESGSIQDFTAPLVYTVTAEDGSMQDWIVTLLPENAEDRDNDGIPDATDICPDFYNPSQLDFNNNGIGDHCEDTPISYSSGQNPPNILWITAEDMSPHLASFGDATASTPNLDLLAQEGVRFFNAFTTSGVCSPSRASIITGMHQNAIGAQHMRATQNSSNQPDAEVQNGAYEAVPPPEIKTFTEYLRAAGYFVTNDNKTDFQFDPPIVTFDESANGADWRDRPDPDQPFFSIINIFNTHESQVFNNPGQFGDIDPNTVPVPPYYPNTQLVREDIAVNYNNIQKMDNQVGNILNKLEQDGLLENTIIFFYTDHGAGLPRAKRWIYDSGIRVPLIVRFPDGSNAGAVTQELISTVDLAPTLLSLAGLPIPEHLQGQAFLGDAATVDDREYIYAARDRMIESYDYIRAVRDGQFKLIRNYDPSRPYIQPLQYRDQMNIMQELYRIDNEGTADPIQALWLADSRPEYELYDLSKDPHEVNNLADDPAYAQKFNELKAALDAWMINVEGSAEPDVSDLPAAEQALINAGWPSGQQPTTAIPELTENSGSVAITCATEGASIAYKLNDEPYWQVYTAPIAVQPGDNLKARAIRIGYKESGEAQLDIADLGPELNGKLPNQVQLVGESFAFAFAENTFTSPVAGEITYTAVLSDDSPLPAWLTFDGSQRQFSGTAPTADQLEIKITATDAGSNSTTANFLLILLEGDAGQIVYREVWGTTDPNENGSLAASGWTAVTDGGGDITDLTENPRGVVSRFLGAPNNLDNINAGPTISQDRGFLYMGLPDLDLGFGFTEELCLPLRTDLSYTFSWQQGHQNDQMPTHLAIRVDGQWYISAQAYTNTPVGSAGDFASQAQLQTTTLSMDANDWLLLDYVPGSSLFIGVAPTQDLAEGTIEAFGLITQNNGATNFRADAFTIGLGRSEVLTEPVPDPTLALAAMSQRVQTREDEPVAITLQSGADFAEAVLDLGEAHYSNAIAEYSVGQFPRSAENSNLITTGGSSWTSGFFPGLLWYFYEYTGDNAFQQAALNWTAALENQKNNTGTHDVGFIIGSSFGNGLRLLEGSTEVEDYDAIIIQAAESLISRYDPTIGAIRSWDFGSWNYPVIVDNMMNLELLFLASELSGDLKYRDVAIDHANTTLEHFFRPDGSSYHVVDFDDDGSVISKGTHQGAGPETSWARGQAWGLYGFTMAYRETGIIAYKEIALTIADYILSETFPDLIIPYWDYSVAGSEPRDASAAAITASALLELMHYDNDQRMTYFEAALSILEVLGSPEYSAELGTNNNFILRHSVGNKPGNSEIDVPIIYADYYYVEAQLRLRDLQPEGPVSFSFGQMPLGGVVDGTAPDLTYTPNPDFEGADQFTFMVSSGQLSSNTATVAIDVLPVVETLPVWYRKVFSNATQANQSATTAGWTLYGGPNGAPITTFDGSTTPRGGVGFGVGNPIDQHDATEGLQILVPDQELGYIYIFNNGPIDYLAYTEQVLDRSQYEPTQITWYQGHNRSDMESRVAVRIAGQWYISTEGFTNPAVASGGDFNAQAEQKTFTFTSMASAWQTLDFSAGNVMALGNGLTEQLPNGDIEAFGLYAINSSSNESKTLRFDTYEIQVTDAVTNAGAIVGTLDLQGRSDNTAQIQVGIYQAGTANLVLSRNNVPVDANGQFSVGQLPSGPFDVYIKGPVHLATRQLLTLGEVPSPADFGQQPAGELTGDNLIDLLDLTVMGPTYRLSAGDANFNALADLNGDGSVNILDFTILASNYQQSGAAPPIAE